MQKIDSEVSDVTLIANDVF